MSEAHVVEYDRLPGLELFELVDVSDPTYSSSGRGFPSEGIGELALANVGCAGKNQNLFGFFPSINGSLDIIRQGEGFNGIFGSFSFSSLSKRQEVAFDSSKVEDVVSGVFSSESFHSSSSVASQRKFEIVTSSSSWKLSRLFSVSVFLAISQSCNRTSSSLNRRVNPSTVEAICCSDVSLLGVTEHDVEMSSSVLVLFLSDAPSDEV